MSARLLDSRWDHNGSFTVDVAGPWPNTERAERAARRVARKADPMGLTQWTRLNAVRLSPEGDPLEIIYTFTVSRLPREHYSRVKVHYA